MKYTHLFWDFDGTLYNSYPQMCAALMRMLDESGLPVPSGQEALSLLKHSVFYAVSHYAETYDRDVQELLACFHKHHRMEQRFPPYEGLEDCLKTLAEAGCRHYLYTHRDQLAVELLQRDGLWGYFSGAVTSCNGFPHKPAPDALLFLQKKHRLDPACCIMIGDRGIDIQSGLNAGMAGAVFDPDGFYAGPQPVLWAASMKELQEKLLSIS